MERNIWMFVHDHTNNNTIWLFCLVFFIYILQRVNVFRLHDRLIYLQLTVEMMKHKFFMESQDKGVHFMIHIYSQTQNKIKKSYLLDKMLKSIYAEPKYVFHLSIHKCLFRFVLSFIIMVNKKMNNLHIYHDNGSTIKMKQ